MSATEKSVDQRIIDDAATGYDNAHQHLIDLLAQLDACLRRRIAAGRRSKEVSSFNTVSEPDVLELLDAATPSHSTQSPRAALATQRAELERRVARSLQNGVRLPIVELQRCCALSELEVDIVIACLAVELDRRYERIYGYLHDDMSRRLPSLGLLLELSGAGLEQRLGLRAALHPLATLLHYRVIERVEEGDSLPELGKSLRLDPRIVHFLLGDHGIDVRLLPYLAPTHSTPDHQQLAAARQRDVGRLLAQAVSIGAGGREQLILYLHGDRSAGAATLVQAAAQQLGLTLISVDAEMLAAAERDLESTLFLLFREALLHRAAVFLRNVDVLLDGANGAAHQRWLLRCVAQLSRLVFVSGERGWHWQLPAPPVQLRPLQLHQAGLADQFQAWCALAQGRVAVSELHLLTSLHPLPLDAIPDAWSLAHSLAAAAAQPLDCEHLRQACRELSRIEVNSLARQIQPAHDWPHLVLPALQIEQLRAVCNQARHASAVLGSWCFEQRLSLGKGLNVLFSGSPGTGKTMAAEVIARELQVDLLKIDLSRIVSKYIGETEKNLSELFERAAQANAILLFDEADALLGKRAEVKDAHDRHANTEVAYLLQKMEEYSGICILTTNLRQNIDEAFTRRMRFIIEFPFPEDTDRLHIWQRVWPREVPLAADVDLTLLAQQFRLSGGSIRNIALSAAFLAAAEHQPVAMRHLLQATRSEQQKMGRLVNDADYDPTLLTAREPARQP